VQDVGMLIKVTNKGSASEKCQVLGQLAKNHQKDIPLCLLSTKSA
jgi:hypothetical protein